jgi:ABC-type spermidine/putrescine transport system permease subunit I
VFLVVLFLLPLYVVLSVAFGTVDFENFGLAVPYYAPWWWSFDTFNQTLSQFYVGSHIYQEPLIRTFEYVFFASVICLVRGYAVAYYTARFATKYKGLIRSCSCPLLDQLSDAHLPGRGCSIRTGR